jgi:hypothetical protein
MKALASIRPAQSDLVPSLVSADRWTRICLTRPNLGAGSTQTKKRRVSVAGLVAHGGRSPRGDTSRLSPETQRVDFGSSTSHRRHDAHSRAACRSPAWSTGHAPMPSPNSDSSMTRSELACPRYSSAPDISQIMYPSHDAQTRPQTPSQSHDSPGQPVAAQKITVDTICEGLGISKHVYDYLYVLFPVNSVIKLHQLTIKAEWACTLTT